MAEITTKITFKSDTGEVERSVGKMSAEMRKMQKEAQLAQKGLDEMFKGDDFAAAASKFDGIQQAVDRYIKTMSRSTTVKQELKATTQVATELEAAYRQMSDAQKSSAEGQALRANIDALIEKAGNLKDTLGDVSGAINKAASDTRGLAAAAQGLGVMSAIAQTAAGALSVMGVEEDKVAAIQQKLTSLIAITNGLQTIQNALQKESALMMALNAAKTKIATVAQMGFNAAIKANPIAATLTVLAAAAAALLLYARNSEEAARKQREFQAAAEASSSAYADAAKSVMTMRLELQNYLTKMDAYAGKVKTEQKLVNELNEKYGQQLGYYKSINDWKRVIVENSEHYLTVLEYEMRAQALQAKMADIYAKKIAGEDVDIADGAMEQLRTMTEYWTKRAAMLRDQWKIAPEGYSNPDSNKTTATKRTSANEKKTPAPIGSEDWYEEEIKKLQDKLGKINIKLDPAAYKETSDKIKALQNELKFYQWRAAGERIEVPVAPLTGMIDDLDKKIKSHAKNIQGVGDIWKKNLNDPVEEFAKTTNAAANMLSSFGAILGDNGGGWLKYGANVLTACSTAYQSIAKLVPALQAKSFAEAVSGAAGAGPLGWLTIGAAVASVIAAFASMPKFAAGGIVGGHDHSDGVLARVSSGEMILNQAQQANLWRMINGGAGARQVEFVIRGRDLIGVERNYNSKMGKVR